MEFTFVLFRLLSFVCHSQTIARTMKLLRRPISAELGQILRHQYGIFVAESQTFLLAKSPLAAMSEEKRLPFAG